MFDHIVIEGIEWIILRYYSFLFYILLYLKIIKIIAKNLI